MVAVVVPVAVAGFYFLPHPVVVAPNSHFFPMAMAMEVIPTMASVASVASLANTNRNMHATVICIGGC